jgi:GTP-binding protein
MIGLRTELLNETQGTAVVKAVFHEYQKYSGPMKKNPKGAIISMCEGVTTPYALKEI